VWIYIYMYVLVCWCGETSYRNVALNKYKKGDFDYRIGSNSVSEVHLQSRKWPPVYAQVALLRRFFFLCAHWSSKIPASDLIWFSLSYFWPIRLPDVQIVYNLLRYTFQYTYCIIWSFLGLQLEKSLCRRTSKVNGITEYVSGRPSRTRGLRVVYVSLRRMGLTNLSRRYRFSVRGGKFNQPTNQP